MAIVGLKKTAWDAVSGPQKAVARMVFNQLELGDPVSGTAGGTDWYVWSDWRIDARFVENLAWVLNHLADFTDSPVRDYVVEESDDPLVKAADANLAAAWFTARQDLPAGWVPDEAVAP